MIGLISLLSVSELKKDSNVAKRLCNKSHTELANFQKKYLKDILKIVSFLDKQFKAEFNPDRHKMTVLKTSKGHYYWNNESSKIYEWVIRRIFILSCRYKGKGPLLHFLFSSLTKSWTEIDFIRYETKMTGYIPPYIEEIGDLHKKVFLLLSRYKPDANEDEFILSKLKMEREQYYHIKDEVVSILKKKGKSYYIQPEEKTLSLDQFSEKDEEDSFTLEPSTEEPGPELIYEYKKYIRLMSKLYDGLDTSEQWLVKSIIEFNRKASTIFTFLKKNSILTTHKKRLKINSEKAVYTAFDRIIYKVKTQVLEKIDTTEIPLTIDSSVIRNWIQYTLIEGDIK